MKTPRTYIVKFVVEAARVTHGVSVLVASPERGRVRSAVGTACARPACCRLEQRQTVNTHIGDVFSHAHCSNEKISCSS